MALIKNIIEISFGCGLFINALLFLPQIIRLLRVKDAKGLSLLTFGGFTLIQLSAVLYGVIAKDRLLIIGYLISLTPISTALLTATINHTKNHAVHSILSERLPSHGTENPC